MFLKIKNDKIYKNLYFYIIRLQKLKLFSETWKNIVFFTYSLLRIKTFWRNL